MKCFNHQSRDAVGTCKSCGKGLCPDCAVDMDRGLACRDRCEDEVSALIALIDQNIRYSPIGKNVMGNLKTNAYVQASFLLTAGVVFLLTAVKMGMVAEIPGLVGMGLIFYGCYAFWRGMRIPKQG